ncbi:MAG TPA: rhodanese-like domain-containing protein [Acidobacteriota bacterium]|nr:rhodanese-like domain-containing protein [Acidobacteriota bacterium]
MNKKTIWNGLSNLNEKGSILCKTIILPLILFLGLAYPLHPELKTDKTIYDFHTIKEGVNVPVWFTLTNSGPHQVKIKEIRTFASCVQSRPVTDKVLKPGESLRLDFVFESLGYGGAIINKPIEIHYNDPKKSTLKLYVKGKITPLEEFQAPIGEVTYNYLVLVDIRSPEAFEKEHVLGSINVPQTKLNSWAEKIKENLPKQVIIYLYSEEGTKSDEAVKELRKRGYKQYVSLVGGIKEWKRRHKGQWIVTGKV